MELTHDEIRRASTAKLRKILKEDIDVELDKQEYNLIKYCLDNAMVNLHADTKKIATDVLLKLSNQIKDHEN